MCPARWRSPEGSPVRSKVVPISPWQTALRKFHRTESSDPTPSVCLSAYLPANPVCWFASLPCGTPNMYACCVDVCMCVSVFQANQSFPTVSVDHRSVLRRTWFYHITHFKSETTMVYICRVDCSMYSYHFVLTGFVFLLLLSIHVSTFLCSTIYFWLPRHNFQNSNRTKKRRKRKLMNHFDQKSNFEQSECVLI